MDRKKHIKPSFSDLPEVTEAIAGRLRDVKNEIEQGKSVEEAIAEINRRREAVLRQLVALRYDFIGWLESTVGPLGEMAFRLRIRSGDAYLKAAIESYKQQNYSSAVACADMAMQRSSTFTRAVALRGFVQAIRTSPDYEDALACLEEAVRRDPENTLYHRLLEIVHGEYDARNQK